MTIRIHIERLVIKAGRGNGLRGNVLGPALEQALARRLAAELPPALRQGGTVPSLSIPRSSAPAGSDRSWHGGADRGRVGLGSRIARRCKAAMTGFPRSPRLLKGGIALLDPLSGAVQRIVPLQYNPNSITRTLQVQDMGDDGNRADVLRLKGPAIETIKIEAEIDITDQLERGDRAAEDVGLQPQLAALEIIVQPSSQQLMSNNALADSGALEIIPMETALAVFIWSKTRVMPVKVTDFSITEEAFDPSLNPIEPR